MRRQVDASGLRASASAYVAGGGNPLSRPHTPHTDRQRLIKSRKA